MTRKHRKLNLFNRLFGALIVALQLVFLPFLALALIGYMIGVTLDKAHDLIVRGRK